MGRSSVRFPGRTIQSVTIECYAGDFNGYIDGKCASESFLWFNQRIEEDESFNIGQYLTPDDLELAVSRYDGCIIYVDDRLHQLLDHVKRLGIYNQTLIAITSDHGEEFLDHGRILHGNGAFEELIRVPLVIKFSDSAFAGTRVDPLTATIDLMPTILDVLEIPLNGQALGVSLMPSVRDGRSVHSAADVSSAVRPQGWKVISDKSGKYLFYLRSDPREQVNLAQRKPDILAPMLSKLKQAVSHYKVLYKKFQRIAQIKQDKIELTKEEIEKLKSLG